MEPLLSVAFSLQSNKGVYAVLLGSGISRAAQIPTGWEIVLELVRKLALLNSESCEPDPTAWFIAKYGKQPDYAELLEMVAATPAERQQLLRSYFEPTPEEQEDGWKQPTKAHRAIAQLVADGYIRVIVTTNFDRLMERALDELGIAAQVLSTPDQIAGALPLVHQPHCIIKVHGDYLDPRIKNTPDELAGYDDRQNTLLDQVFDQFGLITCGWSADWDVALRAAIERAPSRRFTTYWAARGAPSDTAQRLLEHRAGKTIPINDADSFFTTLQEKVTALAEFNQPHPLSAASALATTKRYLAEDKYRIRLGDLIHEEAKRAAHLLWEGEFGNFHAVFDSPSITRRVRYYDQTCQSLVAMGFACGKWGDENGVQHWQDVQKRLRGHFAANGSVAYLGYQNYPISLISYAACLGALQSNNLGFVTKLLTTVFLRENGATKGALDSVPPFCWIDHVQNGQMLEGMDHRYAPINDWLHDELKCQLGHLFPSVDEFTLSFDRLEILIGLVFSAYGGSIFVKDWAPPGAYGYRKGNYRLVIDEVKASIETHLDASEYITSKLLGSSKEQAELILARFDGYFQQSSARWW
ncbi:SIR2 family protein [Iodobacter sp. LRB]|uniref:SIR2 family NAD-dependent protein deacylase n=1 Tax=Iodobacter sp. LRB TaxID=3127955 RepID=UPI00307E3073